MRYYLFLGCYFSQNDDLLRVTFASDGRMVLPRGNAIFHVVFTDSNHGVCFVR